MYRAFDVISIKQNFDFIESVLIDYSLADYLVVDSADIDSCTIRSGVILVNIKDVAYKDVDDHYLNGLSICIAPTQIVLKDGYISKASIFQIEMDVMYSQNFISQICEFIMFLIRLLLHEKESVKLCYKIRPNIENQNVLDFSTKQENTVDELNYTTLFFESTFRDKGLELQRVSDSIYSIDNKVEIVYGRHTMACRLKYDLNSFATLGYHNDIRIDNKFQISLMILPSYSTQRVDIACDLVVESVKHLLKSE